jgi:preprotein translocase subunit SecA
MVGFCGWARQHFDVDLDPEKVRAAEPQTIIRELEQAAERKFRATDLTPLDAYLVPGYAARELSGWASRTLGVEVDPAMFTLSERAQRAGGDIVAESTPKLLKAALDAYRERELSYPVEFAIEVTSNLLQQNPQAALQQFCAWVKSRYELVWAPEALPSNEPAELRKLLIAEARTWDEAKIAARAKKAAAAVAAAGSGAVDEDARAAAVGAAMDRWFQEECLVRLTDDEQADAARNPEGFARERITELLRGEVTQFERWILLQLLDTAWKDHLHGMDQLRDSIGFRAFSQKDPRIEFKKESSRLYEELQETVRNRVTDLALKGRLAPQVPRMPRPQPTAPSAEEIADQVTEAATAPPQQPAQQPAQPVQRAAPPAPAAPAIAAAAAMVRGSAQQEADLAIAERAGTPQGAAASSEGGTATAVAGGMPAVGRNEPCPCGSGKKYKQCHGRKETA